MKLKCISFLLCLLAAVLCTGAVAKTTGVDLSALIPSAPSGTDKGEAELCRHPNYGSYLFDDSIVNLEFARRNNLGDYDANGDGEYRWKTGECGVWIAYCPDCQDPLDGAFVGWTDHEMNACTCEVCGWVGSEGHTYEDGVCTVCGAVEVITETFTFTVTNPNAMSGGYNEYNAYIEASYKKGDVVTVEFEKGMTLAEFLASEYASQLYGTIVEVYSAGGTAYVQDNALLIGTAGLWSIDIETGSLLKMGMVVMSGDTVLEAKHYDFEAMAEEVA